VDDEPEARPRRGGGGGGDAAKAAAAAGAGLGIGAILAIVGGLVAVLCLCGVGGVLVAMLVPAVGKVRESAARAQTQNNMKQIALACHAYHDTYKTFPSPKMSIPVTDLSWRVSILPYMEHGPLFNNFDKNGAWDNPRNQQLMSPMPVQYEHVLRDQGQKGTTTFFQYFTGPNTLWPTPTQKVRMPLDIPDGTSNTFLFADAATGVPWTKPADMAIQPGQPIPLPPDRFMAAFCDGSVRIIDRRRAPDAALRLYIDPKDGQALPPID
jgi:hypothetical protein